MKEIYIFCAIICSRWCVAFSKELAKSGCLEREKALSLLETAENYLANATKSYPSCEEKPNSANQTECSNEKSLAYIEISKKLISDVRENFPSCSNSKNETKEEKMKNAKDCSDILAAGHNESGIYTIWPEETPSTGKPLRVYCDMETDGGGWTVIQRRGKFPVQQDFYLDWESYKYGFGDLKQEFWLGNENIRVMCLKRCKLRFDMKAENGEKRFAQYDYFILDSNDYRIHIGDFKGNVVDSLVHHNLYKFSTKDKDTSGRAMGFHSGWWHGDKYKTNLNGLYKPGKSGSETVYWYGFHGYDNLAAVEMKVKLV